MGVLKELDARTRQPHRAALFSTVAKPRSDHATGLLFWTVSGHQLSSWRTNYTPFWCAACCLASARRKCVCGQLGSAMQLSLFGE